MTYRDLPCYTMMWATASHGHDCGKLQYNDERSNQPMVGVRCAAIPVARSPSADVPRGISLGARTAGHQNPPGAARPAHPAVASGRLCRVPITCAGGVFTCVPASGCAERSAVTGYIFQPLQPVHAGFKECAMSSSGTCFRLRQHMQSAGIYNGETCHSFRRGTLQHRETKGADEAALLALGQMRSVGTLKRYLDRTQHEKPGAPSHRRM